MYDTRKKPKKLCWDIVNNNILIHEIRSSSSSSSSLLAASLFVFRFQMFSKLVFRKTDHTKRNNYRHSFFSRRNYWPLFLELWKCACSIDGNWMQVRLHSTIYSQTNRLYRGTITIDLCCFMSINGLRAADRSYFEPAILLPNYPADSDSRENSPIEILNFANLYISPTYHSCIGLTTMISIV